MAKYLTQDIGRMCDEFTKAFVSNHIHGNE